ncbi:MAG: hypothetical protein EAX96_05380 [Candidatus Lokiarchaeota archaeon]|nr:hypothetical protein [Candidatus Lokiarchaeota archaeon]
MVDVVYSRDRYVFEYSDGFTCIKESSSFYTKLNNFLNKSVKIYLPNDKILSTKLKKIDIINSCLVTGGKIENQLAFSDWLKIEGNF